MKLFNVKFFKENNDKRKEVPAFPAGYCGVEAVEHSFETIHPAIVRSIFHLSLYISSSYNHSSFDSPPFLGLGHTLGMIPWDMSALLSSLSSTAYSGIGTVY